MSTHTLNSWATDHPELVAIALDVTLDPRRRRHYSELVLSLADAAAEEIRQKMLGVSLVPQPNVPPAG